MSDFPSRQTIRSANYSRRLRQQTEQGYQSLPTRPYSVVGDFVALNTKNLVKEMLDLKIIEDNNLESSTVNLSVEPECNPTSLSLRDAGRVRSTKFVQSKISDQRQLYKSVQNGHSLFDKFESARLQREREDEALRERSRQEWNQVESCSSDSDIEILYTESTTEASRPASTLPPRNTSTTTAQSKRPRSSLFNPSRFGLGSAKNRFADECSLFRQICSVSWFLENILLFPDQLPYKISQYWEICNMLKSEPTSKRSSAVVSNFKRLVKNRANSVMNLSPLDFDCIESVSSVNSLSQSPASSFQIDMEFDRLRFRPLECSLEEDHVKGQKEGKEKEVAQRRDWADGRLMLSKRLRITKLAERILKNHQNPVLPVRGDDKSKKIREDIRRRYKSLNSGHMKSLMEKQTEFRICQKDNDFDLSCTFEDMNKSRTRVASARFRAMSSLKMRDFKTDIRDFRKEFYRQEQVYHNLQLKSNKCDKWFLILKEKIDDSVRAKWRFKEVLQKLMILSLESIGKFEINKSRFFKVLENLKDYEIRNPDVFASIGFIRQFIFLIEETKFNQWLEEQFDIK